MNCSLHTYCFSFAAVFLFKVSLWSNIEGHMSLTIIVIFINVNPSFRDIGFCCLFRWMNWWDRSWLIGSWLWIKKKVERSRVLQRYSKSLLFTRIYWTSERLTGCLTLHIINEETENDVASACSRHYTVFMHILFLTMQKKKASKSGKKKKKDKDLTADRYFSYCFSCLEVFIWKFGILHR